MDVWNSKLKSFLEKLEYSCFLLKVSGRFSLLLGERFG